jgi:hypothetical protein
MTIWLALFIVIIIASFILAYLSMKDYQETPAKSSGFGIFLIQNPHNLSNATLKILNSEIYKSKGILTLERLFKGSKSALIITGPKDILEKYTNSLNLLELEDFTNVSPDHISAWEVGVKEDVKRPILIEDIFKDMPNFDVDEQFWWQLTLQPSFLESHTIKDFLAWLILAKKSPPLTFKCQIRAVLLAPDPSKRAMLAQKLESLSEEELIKIPRPTTSNQILSNYKLRSITPADPYILNLTVEEILLLLGKSN